MELSAELGHTTVWEDMARASLLMASGQGRLPFAVQDIGSWWSARAQVDVVGVNRHTRQVLFGEARWRATHVTFQGNGMRPPMPPILSSRYAQA
jgi:hypothetical protein